MFLRRADYNEIITTADFDIVSTQNDNLRILRESKAIEELSMYIRQRYDVVKVFKNFSVWDKTASYTMDDFFEYTETPFSNLTDYVLNDRVSYSGNIYSANDNITHAVWDASKWDLICPDKTIFTCIKASDNRYPDDIVYFTQSDPRNGKIVEMLCDIVLYHLHSLIVPNNVPLIRRVRYNNDGQPKKMDGSVMGTLMAIQNGDIMLNIPIYTDENRGQNIIYGSNMKRNYSY